MAETKRRLSESERAERRRQDRERLQNAAEQLLCSEGWQRWVRARASNGLARYSLTNQLLVALQSGGRATFVAGFKQWLAVGYCVKRGSRALRIMAPMPVKARDRQTGEETGETITLFKAVPVFYQEQVEPLPTGEPTPLEPPREPLTATRIPGVRARRRRAIAPRSPSTNRSNSGRSPPSSAASWTPSPRASGRSWTSGSTRRCRARRLAEAASDAHVAGHLTVALRMLDEASRLPANPSQRADIERVRGRILVLQGHAGAAYRLLVAGAQRVRDVDPGRAAGMLAEACLDCISSADIGTAVATGREAVGLAETAGPGVQAFAASMLASSLTLSGEAAEAGALIDRGMPTLLHADPLTEAGEMLTAVHSWWTVPV